MTRIRSYNSGFIHGIMYNNTVMRTNDTYDTLTKCYDVPGPGDGAAFQVEKVSLTGGFCNYGDVTHPPQFGLACKDYRLEGYTSSVDDPNYAHKSFPSRPSDGQLAVELLQRTNPSRPVVDVPTFVGELKDVPHLLRVEGGHLLKRVGAAYLQYDFGWKLFIQDMYKILACADMLIKRQNELERLYKSGLRCKRDLWTGSQSWSQASKYQQSVGFTAFCSNTSVTESKIWGYTVWTPDYPPTLIHRDMRWLARKAVFGLTVDPVTAWNLIPWSWFIDWFSNIGTILSAARNIVNASHSTIQLMQTTTTTSIWSPTDPNQHSVISDLKAVHTTKIRRIATPTLTASMPILTEKHLLTLGAIGVTRRTPGYFH